MHWGPRRGWRAVALGQTSRLGPEMGCALRAGSEAAGLGPETDRALPARGRVGGAGEGAWRRVSASRRRRNGRVAPYAAARLTGRARERAGRQNAGNSPAHPTSLFSPQSARGEPRHVGCSAPSTTSARPHALFRGFSYKNFCNMGRIPEVTVNNSQHANLGNACACHLFGLAAARGRWNLSQIYFSQKKGFLRVFDTIFLSIFVRSWK